jgi:hypothetical protein
MTQVDPRQLRPRRAWYAVAGAIALVGVLAGVALAMLAIKGFGSLSSAFPGPIAEFDATVPATVHLTAAKRWAVLAEGQPVSPSASPPAVPARPSVSAQCTGRALDGGTVDVVPATYTFFTSADGRTWYVLYQVRVSQDGRYEFSCTSDDPVRYAVGEAPDVTGLLATMLGGFAGTFGAIACPAVGILGATVIIVLTAVRRNANRRRPQFLPRTSAPAESTTYTAAGSGMRTGPSGRRAAGRRAAGRRRKRP